MRPIFGMFDFKKFFQDGDLGERISFRFHLIIYEIPQVNSHTVPAPLTAALI